MSAIIYLLQVSACMGIFYVFYYLMLTRLTFFTINRYYLLFTMLLSFVIPTLTIHVHQPDNYPHVMQQVVYVNTLQNVQAYTFAAPSPQKIIEPAVNWLLVLKMVYWLVAAGLFTHLVIVLIGFFSKLKYRKIDRIGKINILRGNKKLTNGSFLNYIFLNDDELSTDELQQIIAHEMLHVKLLHSVDRIIAKIIQIILWFNPFVYLYARSIEENHEFEVDREIARSTDKSNYADLLLHLSVAGHGMLYHNFSKVPLKKRMMMLFNKPSAKMKRVIYIGIIPVVVVSCLAFARLKSDDKKSVTTKQAKNQGAQKDKLATQKQKKDAKAETLQKTTHPFSVINLQGIGPHPLVLIDGKQYPDDILYKISSLCIAGTSISSPVAAEKKYGAKAKDGLVTIRTHNYRIINMTPIERENSVKEAAVPLTQFYTKLVLKKDDGKLYDKIIIHFPNGSETSSNEHGAKVAFYIDGKRYSEDAIKKLSPKFIATLNGEGGIENPKLHPKKWPNAQDCESVIYFTTATVAKTGSTKAPVQYQYPPPIVKPEPPRPFVAFNPHGIIMVEKDGIRYMIKNGAVPGSFAINDIAAGEKFLAAITDKTELFHAQNSIAWTLAEKGENLEFAEKISKQSVDIVNDQYEHPVAGADRTVEQAKTDANGYRFMVGDTYAYILYKEGRYADALAVQQPLYDRVINKGGGPVTLHYAQILMALGDYKQAIGVAEEAMKSAQASEEWEAMLKECYVKIHVSDRGYNEYLVGIRAVSKTIYFGEWAKSAILKEQAQERRAITITDTIEFAAKRYNVKPTDHLADLLKLLPNVTVDEKKAVFFEGKPINKIMLVINNTTVWSHLALLTNAPADRVDKVRIINVHSNDPDKKMTMEILMPKVIGSFTVTGDSTRTVNHTN